MSGLNVGNSDVGNRDGVMDDQERQHREVEERWEKEFGPQISPRRKWLTGLFVIAAFLAIIALAFVSAPTQ